MTDSPAWDAQLHEEDGAHIVVLAGEIDLAGADDLQRLLIAQINRPTASVVVADLSRVTFLDSAALSALIRAFQHAQGRDRRFVIARPTPVVRRILQLSGLYDVLSGAGE